MTLSFLTRVLRSGADATPRGPAVRACRACGNLPPEMTVCERARPSGLRHPSSRQLAWGPEALHRLQGLEAAFPGEPGERQAEWACFPRAGVGLRGNKPDRRAM